ncbi:hypothetical protein JAAARDRAFT_60800 [Jaapia argillacea MUCL 33604]|uniref:RRM domain-containing protein n=1 Tax=Jaapia argillacea MUCL 33604 TaxID=933084 RepID=A0A067PHR9_9AGAM|nr:hypothetical protein JAAARDRAFT_60800 [Jaapia argillacea MUCL 33604]
MAALLRLRSTTTFTSSPTSVRLLSTLRVSPGTPLRCSCGSGACPIHKNPLNLSQIRSVSTRTARVSAGTPSRCSCASGACAIHKNPLNLQSRSLSTRTARVSAGTPIRCSCGSGACAIHKNPLQTRSVTFTPNRAFSSTPAPSIWAAVANWLPKKSTPPQPPSQHIFIGGINVQEGFNKDSVKQEIRKVAGAFGVVKRLALRKKTYTPATAHIDFTTPEQAKAFFNAATKRPFVIQGSPVKVEFATLPTKKGEPRRV